MKSDLRVSGNRIQITRIFDAPRRAVFGYWASAEKLQRWSSCKEAVGCQVVMDFRVGGSFTQKMQLRVNGQTCEFSMTGTYEDIVEPERIAYRADFGLASTQVTVEFFEQGTGTRVVLTHDGCPDAFFGQNVSEGTSESFDNLDSLLAIQVAVAPQ